MKCLCEINDKIILGLDGTSMRPPRLTARAIVKNQDGLYAVMYAEKFGLYSFCPEAVSKKERILLPRCGEKFLRRPGAPATMLRSWDLSAKTVHIRITPAAPTITSLLPAILHRLHN